MEYNLAGIRDRIIVGKLDDEEFDASVVDGFINDTQRDIFNEYELPFQEKIFSGTIPAGATMFNFPKDVALIQNQVIVGPDGVQRNIQPWYVDFREFTQRWATPLNNEPAQVSFWSLYGGNMLLSQPTDQEYTMQIFYIRKPTTLVENTDIPEIPEEFSELLILGAYKRIQERNEDYDQALITNQQYNNLLNLLVTRYGYRQANGPIKMKNQQIVRRPRRG